MIYIIRHGQTALNKAHVLQGRTDQPLNELGIQQAEEVARWFADQGIRFDQVISSPLQRAVRTGQIVAGEDTSAGVDQDRADGHSEDEPMIRTDERLLEMDYGPYEGMDLSDPAPEILEFFLDFAGTPAPEGMEPLPDIVQRLGELLEDLRRELTEEPQERTILLSTHAIAMKGALEYLTPDAKGMYWGKHIANCAVYAFDMTEDGFTVPEEVVMGVRVVPHGLIEVDGK